MATALDFYAFFDYQTGDDDTYKYTAEEMSEILAGCTQDGIVYGWGQNFAVTTGTNSITIGTGAVWIDGHFGYLSQPYTMTFTSTGSNFVYLMLDTTNRRISIETSNTTNGVNIGSYTYSGRVVQFTDLREYTYSSSGEPQSMIYISSTQPTAVTGGIWIKPQT